MLVSLCKSLLLIIQVLVVFHILQGARCDSTITTTSGLMLVNPLTRSAYTSDEGCMIYTACVDFCIPAQTTANITIDIRHMWDANQTSDVVFSYATNWDITFIVGTDLNISSLLAGDKTSTTGIDLPNKFISKASSTIDTDIHSFNIFSMSDQQLLCLIRIFSQTFFNLRSSFAETMSIELIQPNRAVYNSDVMFMFYIDSSWSINTPVNAIPLSTSSQYPSYLVSYKEQFYNSTMNLTLTDLSKTPSNAPSANYFKSMSGVFMPQLPYFSNCRKFGSQAILSNIIESSTLCALVDYDNVKPISPFTFGDVPVSDTCTNAEFDCVLDEYLEYTYSEKPWFQQADGTVLFQMTPTGISFNQTDLNSNNLSTDSLIDISTTNSIASGYLPKKVSLTLNYYQVTIAYFRSTRKMNNEWMIE